ncbi:MAG: hypothetical protein HYX78_09170 [Armatimonadetes bacterium]|nr:hypothetical protein [Armatimonadota bacterium]
MPDKPKIIRFIETRFARKPPPESVCEPQVKPPTCLKDGSSVVIIGGGIAGPAFARRVICLAIERGLRINVTLISRPSCNYCGGLITNLSLETLRRLYAFEPPAEVVLTEIDEAVLVNSQGSAEVMFESPLASIFRTSRFGQVGFDDNFRTSILADVPDGAKDMLTVVEPAVATAVELGSKDKRGAVTYTCSGGAEVVEADLIVIATGLRSIESKLIAALRKETNYKPPKVMKACVTEVDITNGGASKIGRRILIVSGVITNAVVALIPKQRNWITIAGLKKHLTLDDIRTIFNHPAVREYIQVDDIRVRLPCDKVCSSGVFVGPAGSFYGDGWVTIGDLTGYGRVLKDGYFAALFGAELAAHTAFVHGCSREAFARHYHSRLRSFEHDNRMGMTLFHVNNILARSSTFNRVILDVFTDEKAKHPYGGLAHAAFRALSTGEISYISISLLFIMGFVAWLFGLPRRIIGRLSRLRQRRAAGSEQQAMSDEQ